MDFVEIGLIYDRTDQENPVARDGWHVDSLQRIVGAEQFLVTPSSPAHGFAGVPDPDVFRYKFDSKEQFESLLAAAVGAVNGPTY
jgi:hypothetical protein